MRFTSTHPEAELSKAQGSSGQGGKPLGAVTSLREVQSWGDKPVPFPKLTTISQEIR